MQKLLCSDSEVVVINEIPILSTESPYAVLEQKLIAISKENVLLKNKISQQERT